MEHIPCIVCGKPSTSLINNDPHCPAHEYWGGHKEELPVLQKKEQIFRSIRKKSLRCQVPNCEGHAAWRCDQSGFRYCFAHKHPHGTSERKHTYSKLKVVSA